MTNSIPQCTKKRRFRPLGLAGGTLFVLFLLGLTGPKLSAQPVPFEDRKWKSVDQFVQTPVEQEAEAVEETPEPAAPQTHAAPKTLAVETPALSSHNEPEIIIDTTADGRDQALIKKSLETEKGGESFAAGRDKTADVARETPSKPKAPVNPFNIRLAGLPSVYVKPAPAEPIVRPKKKIEKKKDEPPQPKATKEACEALSAMQKRELAAIEKDRQTLTALQEAIKDLGLSNKLNFTPGKGSLLGTSKAAENQAQAASPQNAHAAQDTAKK